MAKSYPETIPQAFASDPTLTSAYRRGWNHGHGIACHNVPTLGKEYWTDAEGRLTADAENIRDVHQALCFAAESNSRQFSPFAFTAHEFNSADRNEDGEIDPEKDGASEALWQAFEEGTSDAIFADLAEYDDSDYGIEDEDEAEDEDPS